MKTAGQARRCAEAGVVLLIAIFVLMLVSVVAIALIVSSGTESALAANYRSSATVYYAAMAGLEEARGRLQPKNPNYFNNTQPGFMPGAGATLGLGSVRYVVNPVGGEVVNPQDPANPYFDGEYQAEFNTSITAAPDVRQIPSISGTNAAGIPGPVFKWVRINAVTEQSLKIDVDGNGTLGNVPLYYDPMHKDAYGALKPSLVISNAAPTAVQAFGIAALAVLPNGSRKLLQYVVGPVPLGLNLPSALIMDGNNIAFTPPPTPPNFQINGTDQFSVGACNPGTAQASAVGYINAGDQLTITQEITNRGENPLKYTGVGPSPSVTYVGQPAPTPVPFGLSQDLMTIDGLNSLVRTIRQNADANITPPSGTATQRDLPTGRMSPTTPLIVVVNGNLDTTGWSGTGYGLLLVTGKFTYDTNSHWWGVVLAIGQGRLESTTSAGSGDFRGAVLIARLFDNSDNPLPSGSFLGASSFAQSADNNGILYSSCWISTAALPGQSYKVLSFREIPQ